jgi:tripartite ATP-independent transporter DctP family solute receptor
MQHDPAFEQPMANPVPLGYDNDTLFSMLLAAEQGHPRCDFRRCDFRTVALASGTDAAMRKLEEPKKLVRFTTRWSTGGHLFRRVRHSFALACLALAPIFTASHTPAAAREFRAADTQSEDYPTVRALQFMGQLIEQRTNGRHKIRVFHSNQLGEEKETIEQTRVGAIDINRTNVALIGSFVPAVNVLAMPFLFQSANHLHRVLDGPIGEEILNSFEPYGFIGLTFYDSGARSIYNDVRPVRGLEDLRGLKIRVQQSGLMVDMIRALGAEPVELPYGQVLTGLATKLIDGAENNWPSFVTTDHFKYARFYTLTEHTMSPEVVVMSRKAWEALSEGDRKIFQEAARESNIFMREQWKALEDRSIRQAEAAGITILRNIDRAPFEAAMAGVYEKTARDPALGRLIERIRQVQ